MRRNEVRGMRKDIVSMEEYGLDPKHRIEKVSELFEFDDEDVNDNDRLIKYLEENFDDISENDCEYLSLSDLDIVYQNGWMCLYGVVSGEYTYTYDWKDADDFSTQDIEVECDLKEHDCSIEFKRIEGSTYEELVRMICLEIYKTFERTAEDEGERDYDRMKHPDAYLY